MVEIASADSLYVEMESLSYSEPLTVKASIRDWKGEFFGGNAAFTRNRLETGWTHKNYQFGIVHRYDYELSFSEDTADFVYRIKNKQALPLNRFYNLNLKAHNIYTTGLRTRYTFNQWSKHELVVGVSAFKGRKLTKGRIVGNATVLTESDYDFQFDVDYYYSNDLIFRRTSIAPDGYGVSFDLFWMYQASKSSLVSVKLTDLLGRMVWIDAPHTAAIATTDTKTYDSNGFLIYKPSLSGKVSKENYVQHLPVMGELFTEYKVNSALDLYVGYYYTSVVGLTSLGFNIAASPQIVLNISGMLETNAVTLGIKSDQWFVRITTDEVKFDDARIFGIDFGFAQEF